MIGNEQKLNVYIHRQHIATMTLEQDQLVLRYNATWQQVGFALSPHLPLQQETPPINVQRFFRNLLPEGMIFEELARQLLLSKFNTFGKNFRIFAKMSNTCSTIVPLSMDKLCAILVSSGVLVFK